MLVVITGGSKCGKSRMAENIIMQYQSRRYYIATMEPWGEEAQAAIVRHQHMRAGKGFETIERYRALDGLTLEQGSAVLLECMGNLCANEMFSGEFAASDTGEKISEKIQRDIETLAAEAEIFVVVTNQVSGDGIRYPKETMDYMQVLGQVNAGLCSRADVVIEAVYGIPVFLKGSFGDSRGNFTCML